MKFQVKCNKKLRKIFGLIFSLMFYIWMCGEILSVAVTPKDFWGILIIAVLSTSFLGYMLITRVGAEIINTITVDSDTLIIRRIFAPKRVINVDEIKKYSIQMKRMNKGPRRECIHIFYDDTFIELYEDNVCNYELLIDYLHTNHVIGEEFQNYV